MWYYFELSDKRGKFHSFHIFGDLAALRAHLIDEEYTIMGWSRGHRDETITLV